jgi:hypothetical protein
MDSEIQVMILRGVGKIYALLNHHKFRITKIGMESIDDF